MITEDYVSFEVAKLLKEKGFEGVGSDFYENEKIVSFTNFWWRITPKQRYEAIEAPTLQMAMKWLREVHHYYIQVMFGSWASGRRLGYFVVIQKTDSDFEMMLHYVVDEMFYKTYEEACEAAIKYCLENLI